MTSVHEEVKKVLLEKIKKGKDPFPEIIGQEDAKRQIISSLIAGRNIVIVGPPGTGKTTIARLIANLLPPIKFPKDVPFWAYPEFPFTLEEYKERWKTGPFIELRGEDRFIRVQGSYDLTIEDLIGDIDPARAMKYGIRSVESFVPGKIFRAHKGVLFFDEVNRAPPKVQNALLQLLEERRITIGPHEFEIPIDFIFIGTMNPEDYSGVERLSDVFLDRFDVIYMNYPENVENEKKIVLLKGKKLVKFPEKLLELFVEYIQSLRNDNRLDKKPSVRTSIGIYEKAQALALIDNKTEVELQHIYEALLSVLPHRIRLKPSVKLEMSEREFVSKSWESFLRGKGVSDFFNRDSSSGKGESFKSTPPEDHDNPEKIFEKASKKGYFILDENVLWDEFEQNVDLISEITGFDEKMVREYKNSRFRKELKKNLSNKIKLLKKSGYLDESGKFTEKMVRKYSAKILASFDKEISGIYEHGKYDSNAYGRDEHYYFKNFGVGDKYNEINPKESIKSSIKRRSTVFVAEKKKQKKGGHFIVLLDASGSMYGNKIAEARKALTILAYKLLEDGNMLSIIVFNDKVIRKIRGVDNIGSLLSELYSIIPNGGTDLAGALMSVRDLISGEKAHVLLITDAIPTYGENPIERTLNAVKVLSDSGVTVSVVGISLDDEGIKNAEKITKIGNGKFYMVKRLEDLYKVAIIDYYSFRGSI